MRGSQRLQTHKMGGDFSPPICAFILSSVAALLQKRKYILRSGIRLSKHRNASLLQDLPASQRLSGKVRIHDSATR